MSFWGEGDTRGYVNLAVSDDDFLDQGFHSFALVCGAKDAAFIQGIGLVHHIIGRKLVHPQEVNAVAAQVLADWQTSIEFYRKVVDENRSALSLQILQRDFRTNGFFLRANAQDGYVAAISEVSE